MSEPYQTSVSHTSGGEGALTKRYNAATPNTISPKEAIARAAAIDILKYEATWTSLQAVADNLPKGQGGTVPHTNLSLGSPCPKVFVYDSLPSSLLDVDPKEIDDQTFVFGAQLDKNLSLLRNTNQYSLALILWHRLRRKDAECRTNDPSEADLFFVPIFPKPKKTSEWQGLCRNISNSFIWRMRMRTDLLGLKHLNDRTACKHMFVVSKSYLTTTCMPGWFYRPHKKLRCALRVAYSYVPSRAQVMDGTKWKASFHDESPQDFPNLYSVPYPSSVHWSIGARGEKPTWQRP